MTTTAPELPFRSEMVFEYDQPSEMAPGILRIVANNPSPFTYKGTNTYILGSGQGTVAVLDPGPNDDAHLAAILAAVGGARVSHIILTHTHHDHFDLVPRLQSVTGAPTAGFGRKARASGQRRTDAHGGEYVDQDFVPDMVLADGAELSGEGWQLRALHTPGHAPDHLCFEVAGTGILFSGDHVMAWNTSVVAPPEGNMRAYMRGLERLQERAADRVYFPGHGGRLEQPQRLVRAYLMHRKMREAAILDCIRNGQTTITRIVPVVYRGLDARLARAASLSVQAHVEHLIERGFVSCQGALSQDRELAVVSA